MALDTRTRFVLTVRNYFRQIKIMIGECFKCDLNGVVLEYIFLKTPFVNVMVG